MSFREWGAHRSISDSTDITVEMSALTSITTCKRRHQSSVRGGKRHSDFCCVQQIAGIRRPIIQIRGLEKDNLLPL